MAQVKFNARLGLSVGGTPTDVLDSSGNLLIVVPVSAGGTGTTTPALVQGTNVTITGTWPNQTINASGGSAGVTSVTGTAPVVSSGGTTPAISMAAATTSVSGYLTSTDWTIFNSKQAAGSYLTAEADTLSTVTARGASTSTASTFSGGLSMSDSVLSRPTITDYAVTINARNSVTGAQIIDLTLGNYVTATATGAITWTFSNAPTSSAGGFILKLVNGGTAVQSWPAAVKWPAATAPTLTASGTDVLAFITDDGGTTWRGVLSMSNSS